MIHREATIRYAGYDPDDLNPTSDKRICCICDKCGRVRWVRKANYNDLCHKCAMGKYSGENNVMANPDVRAKQLDGVRKIVKDPEWKKNHAEGIKKRSEDPKWKENHAKAMRKIHEDPKWKENHAKGMKQMSEDPKWKENNTKALRKIHEDLKWKINVDAANKKKAKDPDFGRKVSAGIQGIPYEEWESFASDSPYCPLFDKECRESNREKYDRKCFLTGLPEEENITSTGKWQRLSVHHVDMNKQQGCNGIRWKLVPICLKWHSKVHTELWKSRITWLLKNEWIR